MNKKQKFINSINPSFLHGICHRGYWNDDVAENSLKAFKNALDINMAIEFDIRLSKDNELIVFHDNNMTRMTTKDGVIEDLTLKEIKQNYKLIDGQEIPTLKEVIELVDNKIPMVIELKCYKDNHKELSKAFKRINYLIKDKRNIILISFNYKVLLDLKSLRINRLLLLMPKKDNRFKYHLKFLFEGIDVEYKYLEESKVRKYYKKHFINTWTIQDYGTLNKVLPYVDTVTFQHINANKVREILVEKNKKYIY